MIRERLPLPLPLPLLVLLAAEVAVAVVVIGWLPPLVVLLFRAELPCEELVAAVEDAGAVSVGPRLASGGVAIAEGEARSSPSLVAIGGFSSSDMIL